MPQTHPIFDNSLFSPELREAMFKTLLGEDMPRTGEELLESLPSLLSEEGLNLIQAAQELLSELNQKAAEANRSVTPLTLIVAGHGAELFFDHQVNLPGSQLAFIFGDAADCVSRHIQGQDWRLPEAQSIRRRVIFFLMERPSPPQPGEILREVPGILGEAGFAAVKQLLGDVRRLNPKARKAEGNVTPFTLLWAPYELQFGRGKENFGGYGLELLFAKLQEFVGDSLRKASLGRGESAEDPITFERISDVKEYIRRLQCAGGEPYDSVRLGSTHSENKIYRFPIDIYELKCKCQAKHIDLLYVNMYPLHAQDELDSLMRRAITGRVEP